MLTKIRARIQFKFRTGADYCTCAHITITNAVLQQQLVRTWSGLDVCPSAVWMQWTIICWGVIRSIEIRGYVLE